jgi:hypothetical protein
MDVNNTQKAKKAKLECQKKRLNPVTFNSFVTARAHKNPSRMVKKNGGK